MENHRCYGMDAFRIMCCLGVLTYHTMQYAPSVFLGGGGNPHVLWCVLLRSRLFLTFRLFAGTKADHEQRIY